MDSIPATAELGRRARLTPLRLPREAAPAALAAQMIGPVRRRPPPPGDPRQRLGKLDPWHPLMGPHPTD